MRRLDAPMSAVVVVERFLVSKFLYTWLDNSWKAADFGLKRDSVRSEQRERLTIWRNSGYQPLD